MVYTVPAHVRKHGADDASEVGAEEATETGLRADDACPTDAGAEISKWAFFLLCVVYFPMAALRADDLAVTSFTPTSFKEAQAFMSFFLAPVADLEGMERELESRGGMGEMTTHPHPTLYHCIHSPFLSICEKAAQVSGTELHCQANLIGSTHLRH